MLCKSELLWLNPFNHLVHLMSERKEMIPPFQCACLLLLTIQYQGCVLHCILIYFLLAQRSSQYNKWARQGTLSFYLLFYSGCCLSPGAGAGKCRGWDRRSWTLRGLWGEKRPFAGRAWWSDWWPQYLPGDSHWYPFSTTIPVYGVGEVSRRKSFVMLLIGNH